MRNLFGEIILGDCADVLPRLPAGSLDLVLCDPPYATTQAEFDKALPWADLWPELWRVLRPGGCVVVTASQPFTTILAASQLQYFRHEWIWVKAFGSNFLSVGREPMKEHESVLVFARDKWTYNAQRQPRAGSGSSYAGKKKVRYDHSCENYGEFRAKTEIVPEDRCPSSVQKFNNERGLHPQQKPVDLFRYLMRTYSDEGATILDFTCGSGTTAVAAIKEGRRYLCVERELRFYEVAQGRAGKAEAEECARLMLAGACTND